MLGGLRVLVEIGALAGITSVMVVTMMAQSPHLPGDGKRRPAASLGRPRSTRATARPHVSTIVVGLAVALTAGFTPIGVLGELVLDRNAAGASSSWPPDCSSCRRSRPDLPRPFRTPFVPWLPLASIAVNLVLMLSLPWQTWARLIAWMALGRLVYASYGVRHSTLRRAAARSID